MPRRRNSPILSRHLRVKASSPTASTSSMSRTSGSTWMATAKPSRAYMPEEYVFTGASMKRSSSAKATMSWKRSWTSRRLRPSMIPLMATFSRPEISGWKPAPSSMSAETRPSTRREPRVGLVMPASSFSIVDLPDPFSPITPNVVPLGHLEGHAVERGEGLVRGEVADHAAREERALQGLELVPVHEPAVDLGHVLGHDRGRRHTSSASVSRSRSKRNAPRAKASAATTAVAKRPRQWSKCPSNSICW